MERPSHVTEKEWRQITSGRAGRVKLTPAGSHKTWAGWESRECYRCGGELTLEGPAFISSYMVDSDTALSWHIGGCPLEGDEEGA